MAFVWLKAFDPQEGNVRFVVQTTGVKEHPIAITFAIERGDANELTLEELCLLARARIFTESPTFPDAPTDEARARLPWVWREDVLAWNRKDRDGDGTLAPMPTVSEEDRDAARQLIMA
jgi:hypothetical protein